MNKKAFDEWLIEQDVQYTLVATVNDHVVVESSSSIDINDVISESDSIEKHVAQYLQDEYNSEPDYDEMGKDDRYAE